MVLAQAFFSQEKNIFQTLPLELLSKIISMTIEPIPYIVRSQNNISKLIFQNFKERQRLIENNEYDRETSPINSWWTRKTREEHPRTLFASTVRIEHSEEESEDNGICLIS